MPSMTNITEAEVVPIIVHPGTPRKDSVKRKRAICFSPAPTVHEFDTGSPTTRRLELRLHRFDNVDDDRLREELQIRGKIKGSSKKCLNAVQKRYLKNCWTKEIEEELHRKGLCVSSRDSAYSSTSSSVCAVFLKRTLQGFCKLVIF